MPLVCEVCNSHVDDCSAIVSVITCSRKCERMADAMYERIREAAGIPCGQCLSVECNCEVADARDSVYYFGPSS